MEIEDGETEDGYDLNRHYIKCFYFDMKWRRLEQESIISLVYINIVEDG